MAIAKHLLLLGLLVLILAAYLYRTVDKETQKEYFIYTTIQISDVVLIIDGWLPFLNLRGLQNSFENVISNYRYSRLNTSGLIVGVRRFDGVEVIVFDVLHHDKKRPAVVYLHGGGWSRMNTRAYSILTADLARRLNTLVVSVDYRKAPQHPYPAAFDDVVTAVNYLFINSVIFDVDPGRVAIIGDSAGGNLAVAVGYHLSTLRRRNKHGHIPKLIVPLCPVLQIADMQLPSFRDNVNDLFLSKKQLTQYICHYGLGLLSRSQLSECMEAMSSNSHLDEHSINEVKANLDWTLLLKGKGYDNRPKSNFHHKPNKLTKRLSQLALDPRFSPLSALNDTELRLLPPMYIFGSSKDPLRDDAKLLAARLTKVGNMVTYKEIDYYHDPIVFSMFGIAKGVKALDELELIFKHNAIL